jgi:hypothetical protein
MAIRNPGLSMYAVFCVSSLIIPDIARSYGTDTLEARLIIQIWFWSCAYWIAFYSSKWSDKMFWKFYKK